MRSVEVGEFFRVHPKAFDPKVRVDRYLLENLNAVRRLLLEPGAGGTLSTDTVHALIGRTVFACYLVDRKIIGPTYFEQLGVPNVEHLIDLLPEDDLEEAKRLLYALFARLREDFNGDMFDDNLEAESCHLDLRHISVLRSFPRGNRLSRKQLS